MKLTNRREILGTLGSIPLVGVASRSDARGKSKDKADALGAATLATESDVQEYIRLRDLSLDDPEAVSKRKKMPVGKIGNLTFGRLMSGSNLISMNMHARDLDYVSALATHYNTEQRVLMTLKLCEEHGINGIVLKNHNFKRFRLSKYWDEWGGQMKWIADVITTDINKYERLLEEHLALGASAAYLWGGASDVWYHQNKKDNIIKAYEIMRKYDFPVGICAHRIEPIKFCEKEGLEPEFYMKTLHHDRYWSAHPRENRRFIEMYQKESEDHAEYHDNLFCRDFEETIDFMQDVKAPWIAFKVLAAGAIDVMDGLKSAFAGGADFVCLGMFDFQVGEDVALTCKAIAESKNRNRRWF
ncbi:MAG: hypothetical protein JSW47_06330 [Phycisphaerales bacterium]|nr:MAG: hypothetical protein JSW47_06330 [Phycisphaerales bacterium]